MHPDQTGLWVGACACRVEFWIQAVSHLHPMTMNPKMMICTQS